MIFAMCPPLKSSSFQTCLVEELPLESITMNMSGFINRLRKNKGPWEFGELLNGKEGEGKR